MLKQAKQAVIGAVKAQSVWDKAKKLQDKTWKMFW